LAWPLNFGWSLSLSFPCASIGDELPIATAMIAATKSVRVKECVTIPVARL
jgi:hypothetical protein